MNEKVSLITTLLNEGLEFCYTQQTGVIGVSKEAIRTNYNVYGPNILISNMRDDYGLRLSLVCDDDTYVYVEEI